jgi:hypothetical protein
MMLLCACNIVGPLPLQSNLWTSPTSHLESSVNPSFMLTCIHVHVHTCIPLLTCAWKCGNASYCLFFTYSYIAMSYPHDDPFHQNNLSTVRAFLDEKHPSGYLVFNLSDNNYDASKLDNHVSYICTCAMYMYCSYMYNVHCAQQRLWSMPACSS